MESRWIKSLCAKNIYSVLLIAVLVVDDANLYHAVIVATIHQWRRPYQRLNIGGIATINMLVRYSSQT